MDFYTPIKDIFGSSVSAFFFGFMLGFMLCKMFSFMKFLIKALERKKLIFGMILVLVFHTMASR